MGTVYNTNVVSDGLVACWDAGNRASYPGTGTSWTALGAGSAGTLVNTPSFVDGKMGYFTFDGTDEYAEFELDEMTFSDPGTIFLWIRWGDGTSTGNIFSARQVGGDSANDGFRYPCWGFFNNSDDELKFSTGVGSSQYFNTGLVDDEWAQIAVTFYRSSFSPNYYSTPVTLWVNGVEQSVAGGSTPQAYYLNYGKFRIGIGDGGHTDPCWSGGFGLIHVYNRRLSAAEIKQNYNSTKVRFT